MIKLFFLLFLITLSSCSFTKTGFWTEDEKIEKTSKNISDIFEKQKIIEKEFNSNIRIKLVKSSNFKNNNNDLRNDLGIFNIDENFDRTSSFRFNKIENFNYFEPELIFDGSNFIFFDDKGNIIKFDDKFSIIWKKNFYSKQEKKMKPLLNLANNDKFLLVFDNLSKFYAINLVTGDLVWERKNLNPINSQIKIFGDRVYMIDFNNILRCYSLIDGKEIWQFKSENTFLKSKKRNSLLIEENTIYFNNSLGDIIAVDAKEGSLKWQIPTQSSSIYENAFSLVTSDLVAKNKSLIFSNNRNEFYSINSMNGLLNWKQEINSNVRPIFYNEFIFTISNEGFFFVIDSKSGNLIRITDVFSVFKEKTRKKINPIGFMASEKNLFLSTSNGRLLVINIADGKTELVMKIDNEKISRPFIFNKKIILVKDSSIIRLN